MQIINCYSETLDHMPFLLLVGRDRTPAYPLETRLSPDSHVLVIWKTKAENSHAVGRQIQREKPEMDSPMHVYPLSNLSSQKSHTSPRERSE